MAIENIPVAAIVILNYNGSKLLTDYLPPLIENTPFGIDIYVIDNGSNDNSLEILSRFSQKVKVISLSENLGFAEGYNRGLKSVRAKYFALINSDILVKDDWLSPIINAMETEEKIGVCQPKILSVKAPDHFEYAGAAGGFIDHWGYPFCRGRLFTHVEMDQGQYNTNLQVFWASGAAFVIRSDIFQLLKGFDGDFFAHMEEIDLCWRVQRLGYKIYCLPLNKVFHLGGGTLTYGNPEKTYLNFRNSLSMMLKNLPQHQIVFRLFIRMVLDGIAGIKFLSQGQFLHFIAVIRAHFSFYSLLAKNLQKRQALKKFYKTYTCSAQSIYGIFQGSIIWHFFIRKKSSFDEIKENIR